MTISIIRRKLAESEINKLVVNVRLFPNLAYVSPKHWLYFTDPYCLLINGRFAGVCVIHTLKNWVKLGPLVILQNYHGKGLGKTLLQKVIKDQSSRSLFIASSNPVVQHIITSSNFQQILSFFSLPKEIQLFLVKQLIEYISIPYIFEIIRKKFSLRRGEVKFYIKV